MIARPHFKLFFDVDVFADRVLGVIVCGHTVARLVGADASSRQLVDWVIVHRPPEELRV
ncbi:hypothetical protein [Mycobacterium uberis]|uniref:hypothetical protein n=1 Tax=Mycobacterium uberis TaxID=2162698 RepID=UPI001FB1C413|nr:hypothetical protein [Mycobacterium uberis]